MHILKNNNKYELLDQKNVNTNFDTAVSKSKAALKEEGFGCPVRKNDFIGVSRHYGLTLFSVCL